MSRIWTPPEADLGELDELEADLEGHHIEGRAIHGDTPFSVPLISQIDETLWTGGCIEGARLPGRFRFLVSLYAEEAYDVAHALEGELRLRLYDGAELPDLGMLEAAADWTNAARRRGPTLVHCQAGLNRSALVAGLALVRDGMAAADAVALLRERRCAAVLCNPAFERWLLALDE